MWEFDEQIRRDVCQLSAECRTAGPGCGVIAGVDEAGRGCLAGPVVAAAVILPREFRDDRIRDSKLLSPRAREVLYEVIVQSSVCWGVGAVQSEDIDRINIARAALLAMVKATDALKDEPDVVVVDGIQKMPKQIAQMTVKFGDRRSLSVASASIVGKVHRDRLMCGLDAAYPCYGFSSNKGYGTRAHLEALMKHGPCSQHRRTFRPVRQAIAQTAQPELWR